MNLVSTALLGALLVGLGAAVAALLVARPRRSAVVGTATAAAGVLGAVAGDRGDDRAALVGRPAGAVAALGCGPGRGPAGRGVPHRERRGGRGGGGVRDRVLPPRPRRPGGAGRAPAVRPVAAAGAGGRRRRDVPAVLGADGAGVAGAGGGRTPAPGAGRLRGPLVRGHDPSRVRRDPDRVAPAGGPRRLLRRDPGRPTARGGRTRVRAVPDRVRLEGRDRPAARLAAARAPGGARATSRR